MPAASASARPQVQSAHAFLLAPTSQSPTAVQRTAVSKQPPDNEVPEMCGMYRVEKTAPRTATVIKCLICYLTARLYGGKQSAFFLIHPR